MGKDVLRLAGLLACVALATSRLGLLGHELVGHGGVALAAGARVTEVRLFWFAGGWIRYQLAEPSVAAALAIAMAGIAVELVVGIALWLAVRAASNPASGGGRSRKRAAASSNNDGLGRRILRGIGAALVVHAAWYLATGAWHGFGDGLVLYRVLGAARWPVAIVAGLVACGAGFAGAREVLGALAETLPRHRLVGTAIAVVVAGGANAALAAGELHLRHDATYTETMQPEATRVVERELARWAAAQPGPVEADARAAEQARLEREHRTFPFAWLLGAAVAASVIAGARRARPGDGRPPSRRLLAIAGATAAVATCAVIAIGAIL